MPRQNRVTPLGEIVATPERGTCMGNRGVLHNDRGKIVRYHQHKNWIICKLERRDETGQPIKRPLMTPGKYTELFFLDEATALAAGHRPCARCSRPRYDEFSHFWHLGNPDETEKIDEVLHRDRFSPYRRNVRTKKRTYTAPLDELPPGAIILLEPDPSAQPYLVLEDSLRQWSFGGYARPRVRPRGLEVTVLTPASTVRALAAGYRPAIWPEFF